MGRNDILAFISHLRKWAYEDEENEALTELADAYGKTEPIELKTEPVTESASEVQGLNVWCGKCGMHIDEIWKRGGMWYLRNNIGYCPEEIEYCPFCGQKIDWSTLKTDLNAHES